MELIEKIKEAGVVGAGGAGFPTHVKLNCKAECFIVNGIECEPLLRTDQHIMELYAKEIVQTAIIIKNHLGAQRAVIALKKHYHNAVDALQQYVKDTNVELYLSDSFYPAGDEQNLVYCITGRTVPTGGIPWDVGAVVCNVSTIKNIADALKDKPVTDKMVTVAGSVKAPITLTVPIGTPLKKLLDAAGGAVGNCSFIVGGPLMGKMTDDLSQPVTKTTGGLLAISKDHTLLAKKISNPQRDKMLAAAICCQCSMCTQMCPRNAMGLNVEPHKAMRAFASGNDKLMGDINGVFSCCDCGVCTYFACNFGLKPSQAMQRVKANLQHDGIRPVKEVRYPVDSGIENKRIPTGRLLQRLDLKRFDNDAPIGGFPEIKEVRIPLKMHIGVPCEPVISEGQTVTRGQLIADISKLSAKIHASIGGTVTRVTDEFIEIRK
jgi:RnfABCDGE-type electron transport complex C subunit